MVPLIDKSKPREAIQIFPIAATFISSCVWHGYYGGYYLAFISFIMMIATCRMLYRTQLFVWIDGMIPTMIAPPLKCCIGQGLLSYFCFAFCMKLY